MIYWCEKCIGNTEFEHGHDEYQPGRVWEVWVCINCGHEIGFEIPTGSGSEYETPSHPSLGQSTSSLTSPAGGCLTWNSST